MPELILLYGTFMLISLSGALSPGPLTALAISEGARAGRWAGLRLALGHGLVEIPLVFAVAYGLGVWLRRPLVGGLVGLMGAAVLLWMGYGLAAGALRGRLQSGPHGLRSGPYGLSLANAAAGPMPAALRFGHVPGGVVFTLSNPYWSLWWATLGAIYVARVMALELGPLAVGGLALTHWLTDLIWLGGLSLLVASGRGLIGERGYRAMLLVCGVFLVIFGLYFAWSGVEFLARA
jgi:threonine/homoserine/homoserine lactone efflux protein